jgi:hypothetical protein
MKRRVSAISEFELTLKHHILENEIRLYRSRTNLGVEGHYFVAELEGLLTARERESYGLASWRMQDSNFLGTDRISPFYLERRDRLETFDHAGGRRGIRARPACSGSFRHRRHPGNSDYMLVGEVAEIRLAAILTGRAEAQSTVSFITHASEPPPGGNPPPGKPPGPPPGGGPPSGPPRP